jgi:hypothetical protein
MELHGGDVGRTKGEGGCVGDLYGLLKPECVALEEFDLHGNRGICVQGERLQADVGLEFDGHEAGAGHLVMEHDGLPGAMNFEVFVARDGEEPVRLRFQFSEVLEIDTAEGTLGRRRSCVASVSL